MSKKTALEHFQDIKELEVADGPEITVEDLLPYKCEQVEKALHRLEAIDNANPSEALECLEEIKTYFPYVDLGKGKEYVCEKEIATIKQALINAEKKHKALEVIKNLIKFGDDLCAILNFDTYEDYDERRCSCDYDLTQEKFDLLKEVLGE